MFSLLLVPMLLMAGFSIDVGSWYNRASDMRKAADAAALAGVVWLPNLGEADKQAKVAAARNGFVHLSDDITIKVEAASERRIRVTITDGKVGSYLWGNLGGHDIQLTRTAFAEYMLAVPLGSPRNFIGTGLLLEPAGTGFENEELYMSVNPYCTDKVNGDRYQSKSFSGPGGGGGAQCSGAENTDYRTKGYETIIQAPVGRTSAIDVMLYDARYNWSNETGKTGTVCGTPTLGWSAWFTVPYNGARDFNLPTDGQYEQRRYRFTWFGTPYFDSWSGTINRVAGNYAAPANHEYRYRYRTSTPNCSTQAITEDPIDSTLGGSNSEPYTFTLFGPNDTLFDESDDPVLCSVTYNSDTAFDAGAPYLGSHRWNKFCTIPAGARAGDYRLRVTNTQQTSPKANGQNSYGVVARYSGASGHGLCDGRTDDLCPRVHGRDALSVMAASAATTADFFFAEIEPEHDGKTLKLTLFDPGEGGDFIRVRQPTGTNSWENVSFRWESDGVSGSGSTVSELAVRSGSTDKFNGRLLHLYIELDDYAPPEDNYWWKIQYQFGTHKPVTDRTTWEAEVIGDPIHLVEDF